jgi:hypothetical protein
MSVGGECDDADSTLAESSPSAEIDQRERSLPFCVTVTPKSGSSVVNNSTQKTQHTHTHINANFSEGYWV